MVATALEIGQVARFTRDQFEKMIDAGVFDPDARVELLEGVVVTMSPHGNRHATGIARVKRVLAVIDSARADLQIQLPLQASVDSRPEPDLALWAPGSGLTEVPERALLVIEIADTSLRHDRIVKGPIYAHTGTPEYWIVDLEDEVVEVYTRPSERGYERSAILHRGDRIQLVALPEIEIAVSDLLPPA